MKKTLPFIAFLSLCSLAALAQTAPPARRPAPRADTTTARHRARHYTGPKVVDNTQELGQKFRQNSQPTDGPIRVLPVSSPPK